MEKFKAEDYNRVGATYYYRSKDNNTIATYVDCDCNRKFYQLWKPSTFDCEQCNEIKNLKQKNAELENKIKEELPAKELKIAKLEESLTIAVETLNQWKREEDKKDLELENLKKRLAELEANETINQNLSQINLHHNLESELESISSHSESNYSLIEESS